MFPAQVVGEFVSLLEIKMLDLSPGSVIELKNPVYELVDNSLLGPGAGIVARATNFTLLSVSDLTNMDLVRLIYWVFGDFPHGYQLLRCSKATEPEEIELFFDRVKFYPKLRYLILGINTLKNELQQVWERKYQVLGFSQYFLK